MPLDDVELSHISQYILFTRDHEDQLNAADVPMVLWESLYVKLVNEIFDAGTFFKIIQIEDFEDDFKLATRKLIVSNPEGISTTNYDHVFLVDLAWIYEPKHAKHVLQRVPGLLPRMCKIMGCAMIKNKDEMIEFVLKEMWKYNNTMTINEGEWMEDRMPLWYILDEVGSAINHSEDPNFRVIPFYFHPVKCFYAVMYPIKNVAFEEEITRDFVEKQSDNSVVRKALQLPWVPSSFDDIDFSHIEPDEQYFTEGRLRETMPDINTEPRLLLNETEIAVFTQDKNVSNHLKDKRFKSIEDDAMADILWLIDHFKDYEDLTDKTAWIYVNQFPCEIVLTCKDLLCATCIRTAGEKQYDLDTLESFPSWFPTSYNLHTEIVKFVAYYKKRESKGLDNYWIVKPWNLARGMDMHITNNLNHILRLPSSGPKLAQKYITKPVLFKRLDIGSVKFDIRYILLLKCIKPFRVYIYSNFFLRFANKPFDLKDLYDYEKHYTVMNYTEPRKLYHLMCADFIPLWNEQYPDCPWQSSVEPVIFHVLEQMLTAAVALPPPKGLAESNHSRAMYAVDLILEWKHGAIQPVILEVNFSPDCNRACKYYPDFYDDIFKCLFMEEINSEKFIRLFANQ